MSRILLMAGLACSLLCIICFVVFICMTRRREKTEQSKPIPKENSPKSSSLCIHMADRDCTSQDGIYCRAVPCVKDLSKVVESGMGVAVRKRNTDGVGMFI